MADFVTYLERRWDDLLADVIDHAMVVGVTLVIATAVGVTVGVLTWQRPTARSAAIAISATFLTIPSFAMLGLLIPLFGLGWTPTVVALVLYSLLPIVRNTIVGLREVDPALVEAGRGVGMSSSRVLRSVQLPLAWPVIITGIRVSAQLTIGIAAIAAYVEGPGLGNPIFDGLARLGSRNALNSALAGTLGVVILALLVDLGFVLIRRLTTSRGIRV